MTSTIEPDTDELTIPTAPSASHQPRTAAVQVEVTLGSLSHQGMVRLNNEDHFLVASFGRSLRPLASNLPADLVPGPYEQVGYGMLVADGMGGMAAGEVASCTAIAALVRLAQSTPDWIMGTGWTMAAGALSAETVMDRMADRFRTVDDLLIQKGRDNPELLGMGTTLTMACSLGLDLILCHVGDSRAYLFRQGSLLQLTRDMTRAQDLVEKGQLDADKAATNSLRHALTQYLGGRGQEAEVQHVILEDDDRLLLCTDGLTEMARAAEIAAILQDTEPPQNACQALVDLALKCGGKDNVTVILARYRVQEQEQKRNL